LEEGLHVEILPCSPEADLLFHESAAVLPSFSGLPDDLAINHDHYLHGLPKQRPRRGRWIPEDKPAAELTEQQTSDYTGMLATLAAETHNLPPDFSSNHDSYLHGWPKR